ncbi:PREDICTED: uncharacterized protein LOC106122447 [Papilio xuthus]|uniref:Uncharacterized protein LOC106122447 n=1 Tax=Papilio xuthus TaxID=66420 RepID=A0AAJ7EEB9_PAPXU|nr:PREDICTED: uncharacterized protein LOC106122447 [Papilio xuthus]
MKYFVLASVLIIFGMSMMPEAESFRQQLQDPKDELKCDVQCGTHCSLECSQGDLMLCCYYGHLIYCRELNRDLRNDLFKSQQPQSHDDDLLRLYRSVPADGTHVDN